ncbi:MAG: phosphate ABC transporter substrate-binding protein [Calditrichaeota bacterium]|nr:phosphate ABC transporter substrate-binding protein [Candidatus Cloacimonadota bacterium]MCA9787745.1 phosphate ABC transporter substrate-binding protein [Candidatus Cloacimonadota bacterium]MCB1048422.1 phosphate ABC transporter substrate-binding protein [Calditrichota bacterium]MCB9474319.1 phosphate ABC transporter substrate-binding protein [Candidatus Delongbacteria bacterium]
MLTRSIGKALLVLGLGSFVAAQAAAPTVDPAIPSYKKVEGLRGTANSIGSDTMNNLMTLWLESFRAMYPQVNIQIEGKGSSTAPPALIEGTAQFGPMSRPMKSSEVDKFEEKYGFAPVGIRTSLDALAVFVPADNKIPSLSLEQVDAIFSRTCNRGHAPIQTWGELLPGSSIADKPISRYGRNSASGTYGFFKEEALKKGDYLDTVKEQPGSASVVQSVAADRSGIGYSGIGYATSGVRAVPLSESDGSTVYEPNLANVISGDYPLARPLLLYVVADPDKGMDPLVREFLRFVLSKEGQQIVIKDGYLPLSAEMVTQELARVK